MVRILLSLFAIVLLSAVLSTAGVAAQTPEGGAGAAAPTVGGCASGSSYDPHCDVNGDSTVNVNDVQLVAAKWNTSGTFVLPYWSLTGNSSVVDGTNFLGTTDAVALDMRVANTRALRLQPSTTPGGAPNVIGGSNTNSIGSDVYGGFIGGGWGNLVDSGTFYGTVAGGRDNDVTAIYGTIGGGESNQVAGLRGTVPGGASNSAAGNWSFAAGRNAKANHQGAFVWADSATTDFASTRADQFAVRANGGAVITGTLNTGAMLHVTNASTAGPGNFNDGIYVTTARGTGVTVLQSAPDRAAFYASAGAYGLYTANSGSTGVYVYSTNGHGIYILSANQDAMRVQNAGSNALEVVNSGDSALLIRDAASHGIEIGDGVNFPNSDGMRINDAQNDGLQIGDGVNYPPYGFYLPSPGVPEEAIWVNTADAAQQWALYSPDKISAGGATVPLLTIVAQVDAGGALSAGDLVAASGVAAPLAGSSQPLALVRLADEKNWSGVVGVVEGRMAFVTPEGRDEPVLRSAPGAAQPGDYVALTVMGVATVKVAPGAEIAVGQRLTAAAQPGHARALRTESLNGMTVTEGAPTIGVALTEPDAASGTIQLFVSLR